MTRTNPPDDVDAAHTTVQVFSDTADDTPYTGENTPVAPRNTAYGGAVVALELDEGDRVAVWVAGHWLVGTVSSTLFNEPGSPPGSRGRCAVGVTLDGTHRDAHDDLPTTQLTLRTSTDDDYELGPDGWKTVDASIKKRDDASHQSILLGVCGDIVRLPE